jgi:glycosyl transferase family 25
MKLTDIKIFVINLDKRKDRWFHIMTMMKSKKIKNYERISAIESSEGYYGCVLSHIKALQKAKLLDLPEVIIMEDDFQFKGEGSFIYPEKCDVCLYSCHLKKKEDFDDKFHRVIEGNHTDFYLVKNHYYDKLISVFMESLMGLLQKYSRENYLDVYWNKAQKEDLFVCPHKLLGCQMEGFSDIKGKVMNRSYTLS